MKFSGLFSTFFLTFIINQVDSDPLTDCWNQWSRCSDWSSGGTDILWQNCDTHCKCLGYAEGGQCVEVPSICFLWRRAKQCHCIGGKGEQSNATCP